MGEEQRLAGCRVVITRPAEQAAELERPLQRLGAEVRSRPLIAIAPPADPAPLRVALTRLHAYDWMAFTSANAVRACVAAAPAGARWPAVAAVGSGTARAAAAAGMSVALVPDDFSGDALAASLRALKPTSAVRVLWPRPNGAREGFATVLRAAGVQVEEVECYRTVPDSAAAAALLAELAGAPADVLVFTSPSAVRTFAGVATSRPEAAVAVIGGVTGAAATAAGWQVTIRPGEQSIPGLVAALAAWWAAGA